MLRDRDNQYELDGLGQEQSLRSISSQGSFDLTVIEIINQLGQPSYVHLGYGDDMYNGLFTRVSLYYPSDGYVFNIRPQIVQNIKRKNPHLHTGRKSTLRF